MIALIIKPKLRSLACRASSALLRASAGDSGRDRICQIIASSPLESEPCGQFNLTPSADCTEYSADVVGEIARRIFEDGVSVPSQGQWALRVTRDCEIRMIEQIVGFRSERDLCA